MLSAITQVWTSLITFLTGLFSNITSIFWDSTANQGAGELTFVGILAIIMAGISICLLVFNLIRSFFPMRG